MTKKDKYHTGVGGNVADAAIVSGKNNITLKDCEIYVSDPRLIASIAEKLKSGKAKRGEIPGATLHNLPFPQNPLFTGRVELLKRLEDSLKAGSSAALTQAIHGLGGIGKTQIAVEYAFRHLKEYKAVLWLKAEDATSLTTSFAELARVLDLPQKDEKDINTVVSAVLAWLAANSGWLLIFDNADEPDLVKNYQPRSQIGRVLITSRAAAFGNLAKAIEVDEMEPTEAIDFLLTRAKFLEPFGEEDRRIAGRVCQELGHLPLAIDQAGAYLEQTHCGLSDYLQSFKEHGIRVFEDERYASDEYRENGHRKTVATTWLMSLERLRTKSTSAVQILELASFFSPDAIPLELYQNGAEQLDESLKSTVADSFKFNEALGDLLSYSLIKRQPGAESFDVHRLVQAVVRDRLGEAERTRTLEIAVKVIRASTPDVADYHNWPALDKLLPHLLSVTNLAEMCSLDNEAVAYLLIQAGYFLRDRAEYDRAGPLCRRAAKILEEVLGAKHPHVAIAINNLAALYRLQGKYEQAEPLYLRALKIDETALGVDHPHVATDLNNLAELYSAQGKHEQAEPLFLRALTISEKAQGPEHPDLGIRLSNFAELCRAQGKYDQAESLYLRALKISETALGSEHPTVGTRLNNLAVLYDDQGKYEQAEPLHLRALMISEKALGPEHPDVGTRLNNLAALYRSRGKYEQAESLLLRAIMIYEKALGLDHPSVATGLSILALLYSDRSKYEQAEPLLVRALKISEKALGPEHPAVANRLNNLAALYCSQGKHEQAEPLYLRALKISEKALAPDHPDVAYRLTNLGILLYQTGRKKEGIKMLQRAYKIFCDKLGVSHPNTVSVRQSLESCGVKAK